MKRMRIEALYRKPNTSKPAPDHKIYPYLLRGMTVERPNQASAEGMVILPRFGGSCSLCVDGGRLTRVGDGSCAPSHRGRHAHPICHP